MPRLRSPSGQASLEYVAVLAVLAIVLTGAAVAVAAPEIPEKVVHHARVALCIVGGDVCRSADAQAAGLEPCVMRGNSAKDSGAVSVGFVRIGSETGWVGEERSDGSIAITNHEGGEIGVTGGVGVQLGPVVDLQAGGTAGVHFKRGRTWELSDKAVLQRIVLNPPWELRERLGEPTYTFMEGGSFVSAAAEAGIGGDDGAAKPSIAELEGRTALGRRVGNGSTTWYFDGQFDLSTLLPSAGVSGRSVLEYTPGSPAMLVVRGTSRFGDRGTTETIGRLALTDPADRLRVQAFLGSSAVSHAAALLQMRSIMRRVEEAGTLERMTFATEEDRDGMSVSVGAGLKVGVEGSRSLAKRRLVDAVVLNERHARRADCLGL